MAVQTDFESVFDKNAALLDVPLEVFDEFHVEQPAAGSKVAEMPIFMLDLAVCPGGVVPLHIFEMRYRQVRSLGGWAGRWTDRQTDRQADQQTDTEEPI